MIYCVSTQRERKACGLRQTPASRPRQPWRIDRTPWTLQSERPSRLATTGGFAASRILEVHGKRMLDNNYQPGFKTHLHRKDMNIVSRTASELGVALPGAALVLQHMNAAMEAGYGELDSAALMKVIEKLPV